MTNKNIFQISIITVFIATTIFTACKKDQRKPPVIEFTTGSNLYTVKGNNLDTLNRNQSYSIGLKITKVEDEIKSINVSVVYDGSSSSSSIYNANTSKKQYDGFETGQIITTRNQAGTEKFTFAVIDFDGNIGTVELNAIVK